MSSEQYAKGLNIWRAKDCAELALQSVGLSEVPFTTKSMFEAPRHHGVVSAEDAQSVAVGMFQQQPQTEAMMPLVLGGYRQLVRKEENKSVS